MEEKDVTVYYFLLNIIFQILKIDIFKKLFWTDCLNKFGKVLFPLTSPLPLNTRVRIFFFGGGGMNYYIIVSSLYSCLQGLNVKSENIL